MARDADSQRTADGVVVVSPFCEDWRLVGGVSPLGKARWDSPV